MIADCLGVDPPTAKLSRDPQTSNPSCNRQRQRERDREQTPAESPIPEAELRRGFSVSAVGPVGHVYFNRPVEAGELQSLAERLVREKNIPGVLYRDASGAEGEGAITWYHAGGATAVPDGAAELFSSHPESLRAVLAEDLAAFCRNEHAGDLVLLGWSPHDRPWTFMEERGAHAGPGPEETQGFLLVPPGTPGLIAPELGGKEWVRPSEVRAAALHLLGREPAAARTRPKPGPVLRVMSYNAHSCIGMDGRVSPRRIARVVDHYAPDLVALQEMEHGRARSRGEDQATAVAELLGYQVTFCPTVVRGEERYGHALLSKHPVEVVKTGELPSDPKNWWPETRSAIWVKTKLGARTVHVFSTHLGLSSRERVAQMEALLGPDWVGGVPEGELVVLCGDFNFAPGSPGYRLAVSRLRDVQRLLPGAKPSNTFSTLQPFIRLDHLFLSEGLDVARVRVPRTYLTRVASDHLPVVADLKPSSSADAEMTTPR
jgi:endonuclease/exonuclease/phosphatase family metal-dependent hydrolase